jgi:hypothetical protein
VRALAILVVLGGSAAAGSVTAPQGWTKDPKAPATSEVYLAPAPGLELVVSRSIVPVGPDHQAAAARAALDDLHAMSKRAALTGSNVSEDGWAEHADPAQKTIDAQLTWRDPGAQLVETARIVLAADAKQLVGVTGECIARDDSAAALRAACTAALATLDPGVDPATRVAVAIAPVGTPPPPETIPRPTGPPATMSESHTPLPPISVPQENPSADRRPVFVGLGIVLLAGMFWWNVRRRARLEEEDSTDDR